jgi:hypothetical protein
MVMSGGGVGAAGAAPTAPFQYVSPGLLTASAIAFFPSIKLLRMSSSTPIVD